MTRPRRRSQAETLLELLERRFPEGVSVGEAAIKLFGADTLQNRFRVYGYARALREQGHAVYALGGIYYLCSGDAEKLILVGERKESQVIGSVESLLRVVEEAVDALEADPDPAKQMLLEELRRRVKKRIISLARKLA
ncbi:MAG: hypothetical protein ACPLTR_04715 [Thermacetogeniaceae bacterium]